MADPAGSHPDHGPTAEESSPAVDARQDEIMTAASSDGRPPSRELRITEWRWFVFGAILVVIATAVWIAVKGVSLQAVGAGIVGVLVIVGANPALWAGLKRGQEERAARKLAQIERHEVSDR